MNSKEGAAYQTFFHMPLISQNQDAENVTVTPMGAYALKIEVPSSDLTQLYTMTGSFVTLVPQGEFDTFQLYYFYPDLPPLSPGTGALVQQVVPDDVIVIREKLPEGVPPPKFIVYLGVDPASVKKDLELTVRLLPLEVLKAAWGKPGGTYEEYVDSYLDKFVGGQVSIFLWGGVPVGKSASLDVVLFFSGGPPEDIDGLSPIPILRDFPLLAGSEWKSHPLVTAVSELPVPVDIYAEFKTWKAAEEEFIELPDGITVDLNDFDNISKDDLLSAQQIHGGKGIVHFKFSDIQQVNEKEPDLFFLVHLNGHNPEPDILSDDEWSSRDWQRAFIFSTGSGYYENFKGSRLGDAGAPLLFRLGLGFWADLISFRPSVEIQSALKSQSRQVHRIEEVGDADNDAELNLDYYPIKVDVLPNIEGKLLSAQDLLNYLRLNINEFGTDSFYEFSLEDEDADKDRWSSVNPLDILSLREILGVVLHIEFYMLWFNVDDGGVVTSDVSSSQFTFSTIFVPGDFGHPVSGNRQFGFKSEFDGTWTFFTRGADRPTSVDDDNFSGLVFRGADLGWKSFQQGFAEFINKNGGKASVGTSFSGRFPWNSVKARYWNPTVSWI